MPVSPASSPILALFLTALLAASSCESGRPGGTEPDSGSTGDAAFLVPAPGSPHAVGDRPADVAVGDVDGDGNPDLAVVGGGEDGVLVVLAGDGEGGFGGPRRTPLPASLEPGPHFVVLGDLDGDGALDAAVTAHDSNEVVLLRGSGEGAFAPFPRSPRPSGHPAPPHNHGLALADLDGDGDLDLLFGNQDAGTVAALRNDGGGTFTPAPGSPFPATEQPYPFAVGDFDGDDALDLAVASLGGSEVALLRGGGRDGDEITFTPFAASPLRTPPRPFHAATADLDGDGHLDLVVSHNDSDRASVYRGDGEGAFQRVADAETGPGAWRIAIADLDGDGVPDLAAGNRNHTVRVLLGHGDATFRPGATLEAGEGTWTLTTADLDGDGKADLVSLGAQEGTVSVWLQRSE